MPHILAGVNPTWVNASHEPSIEPCSQNGNGLTDAWARKQARRCKGNG